MTETAAPIVHHVAGGAGRAFEQVLLALEESIAAGDLAAGDRLPPERDLAGLLGVSRTSVREALRVLEALGLVSVRRGPDNGVTLLAEPQNGVSPLLRFHLALRHISLQDLIEFRVVVESWAASGAAQRHDRKALAATAKLLSRMEKGDPGPPEFLDADLEFHLALARASGNTLAPLMLEGNRSAIGRAMLDGLLAVDPGEWPEIRRRLHGEHRAVLDAVRAGDGATAAAALADHISRFYRERLGVAAR